MLLSLINVFFQTLIFPKLQVWSFRKKKVAIEWLLSLEWYWVRHLSLSFLHWNREGPEFPYFWMIGAPIDFGTPISPNKLPWFFPSRSESETFYLCKDISLKIFGFTRCSGVLVDRKCRKMLLLLTCQETKLSFLQLYLLLLSFKFSIDTLLLELGDLF